ncbi:MAG: ABC transporter substrate-binding protein [Dehalococcoidia bacterium]
MDNYWTRVQTGRLSRRRVLAGAGAAGVGAAGLALVGCGDDDDAASPTAASGSPGASGSPSAAASPTGEQPVKGGTLRRTTWLNVLGIDPHTEVSVGLFMVSGVYNYLHVVNSADQKAQLVDSASVEQPSPTEFIFKLKPGIKLQNIAPVNGRELVSEDVKYSKERFRDLPKAQNNDFYKTIVDKMETPDQYTFKLTTKKPWAEAMNEMGNWQQAIVPREAVEKFTDLSAQGIGGGPYIMKEYVKGEKTVLVKNPDYYNKNLPHLDGQTWTTILDQATLLAAYKAGQFDIGSGPYEGMGTALNKLDFTDLQKDSKMESFEVPGLSYGSLGLNASVKPFDDPRVRQAMWIGMDRKQFVDKISLGSGQPQGVLSNGLAFWALSQEETKPYIGYDPKKAKDLLTAAGYPDGFSFDIDTSNGVPAYIDHAELIAAELKKIGITANLKVGDLPTFLSEKLFKANFNAVVFTHNPYETPKVPLGFYHKNGLGTFSWWHYDNQKVTDAIDATNGEVDLQKRQKLVKDAQKLILEDAAPLINMYTRPLFQSYYKRVGGFDPKGRTSIYWKYGEYLKPS